MTSDASDEYVGFYGVTSATCVIHPFLREAVASTALRLGQTGVFMPTMSFGVDGPPDEDQDSTEGESDAAK